MRRGRARVGQPVDRHAHRRRARRRVRAHRCARSQMQQQPAEHAHVASRQGHPLFAAPLRCPVCMRALFQAGRRSQLLQALSEVNSAIASLAQGNTRGETLLQAHMCAAWVVHNWENGPCCAGAALADVFVGAKAYEHHCAALVVMALALAQFVVAALVPLSSNVFFLAGEHICLLARLRRLQHCCTPYPGAVSVSLSWDVGSGDTEQCVVIALV